MTKVLRPILRRLGAAALAVVIGLLFIVTAIAVTPTPTPEPAAIRGITISPAPAIADVDDEVTVTIEATNAGNLAATSQTIESTLPAGFDWEIDQDASTLDCATIPSLVPGRLILVCAPFDLERRHLNADETDVIPGSKKVVLNGTALVCGKVTNRATLIGPEGRLQSDQASIVIRCAAAEPTPTVAPSPTVTVAPPTPMATPASSVSAVPTGTLSPLATPRIAPGPPNTGNTAGGVRPGEDPPTLVAWALVVIVGCAGAAWWTWRGYR